MGTWGVGTFENDAASDWVYDLEKVRDLSVVQSALAAINQSHELLDARSCENALAASEVVAALLGKPTAYLPENVARWVEANARLPGAELRDASLGAIEKIVSDSELRDLWAETDDLENWETSVRDLQSRLS
jgi:hypothetical protein